jgi:hypothetical protein
MKNESKEKLRDSQFERFIRAASEPHRSHLSTIFESTFARIVRVKRQITGARMDDTVSRLRRKFQRTGRRPSDDQG